MVSESSAKPTVEEASLPVQSDRPTLKHTFKGHESAVSNFVFLHDNIHIVSGSEDGTMRKWNIDTGRLVGRPWIGKGGGIHALALSPDGKIIACGREDGSVQRWNTNGKMIDGVWTGHSMTVLSLSWSPSGGHLSSGSEDGTILIRKAKGGQVTVGPIKTKQREVWSLAYSPFGDKIASGGRNETICIWDSKTGELVVGPIKDLGTWVSSLVWSSDSTKLYSASDKFARVFDSKSGTLLYRFWHNYTQYSVALSPKNNVLACVGNRGIARLWDTESYQPLGRPFRHEDCNWLDCVSFSQDGRYLAYGGHDGKLTLWIVEDAVPEISVLASIIQEGDTQATLQETRPESPSSSCLDADATKPWGCDDIIAEAHDDPYDNFFQASQPSLSSPGSTPSPHLSTARRLWNTLIASRQRPLADEPDPHEHPKRSFFTRLARSNSHLQPSTTTPNQPTPESKVRAGENDEEESDQGADLSADDPLSASRADKDTDKKCESDESPAPSAGLDSEDNRKLWKRLMRGRGKDTTSVKMAPAKNRDPFPVVVEVFAARGFQRFVTMKRVHKTKTMATTSGALPAAAHASCSSQAGPSSQTVSVQAGTSSCVVSGQTVAGHASRYSQATAGPSSHASPSRFVTYHTDHDSDSNSSIHGTCNKFLDKICFPRGHYHDS
ncbi:WD40-repeat-containing domain protein [Suillus ampliporus]|nr:WD40-repeat-containing domain protein [Suillus ampliporus]